MKESQSEKAAYCVIPTIQHSGKDKSRKTVKRSVVANGSEEGREEWIDGA